VFGEKKRGKIWTNSRSQLSDGKLAAQGLSPINKNNSQIRKGGF
jgi:hypothetical protein